MKQTRLAVAISLATAAVAVGALAFGVMTPRASAQSRPETMGPIHYMPVKGAVKAASTSGNMYYHGGTSDGSAGTVGVETGQNGVYLIYWGSQWGGVNASGCPTSDASNECGIQSAFFSAVGAGQWNNSVTQYCEGVSSGTYFCNGAGTAGSNPTGVLKGIWVDNSSSAPSRPSQSALAAEAVRAAAHFGNTTAGANATVQYVVNTSSGNNASGFGTRYCAWHSSTTSSYGDIAYTNMPYITDAGASCGAHFVNSSAEGATDGITIVGGHEFGETETDIYPSTGWNDSGGAENGDKCAWISSGQGASADVDIQTGTIYAANTTVGGNIWPVQSLWSNAFNNNAGGCVQ